MKICILGPVINDKHFGGVATFNEGLLDGFLADGDEVIVITSVKKDDPKIRYFSKSNILFFNKNIIKQIAKYNPDIIISSMWYGILNKYIKKALPDSKIVHFIHGFPTYRYKLYKRILLNTSFKIFRKYTDYFISNSDFTKCINNEIYGIKCDKTIYIGIKEKFKDFEKIKSSNFIYAGRVVKEKNVDKVCEIFNYISQFNEDANLIIVGDGPEKGWIEQKYKSNKINFVGKKSRKELIDLLRESEIFISLNPHEPFGLVYLEAIINKCKIICPKTGGQVEFLSEFNEVLMIDIDNYENQEDQFISLMEMEGYKNQDLYNFFDYFNYKRVAKELKKLS